MKGSITVEKQQNTKLQDEGKLAYMIAWRDKRIADLQDLLIAQEESNYIFAAYIKFLLERCYGRSGYIRVSKAEIRRVCGNYNVRAEDTGEDYVLYLDEAKSA